MERHERLLRQHGNAGEPVYASDYDLIRVVRRTRHRGRQAAGGGLGDWIENTVASTDQDTGWLIGASLNKVKDPGSWQFDYDYREIDADALVGQFNDSDFVGGGTAGKGHRFSFAYQLTKNVAPALTFYDAQYWGRNNNDDYGRLQADIVVKF